MTFAAPSRLAICTASWPAAPVAPLTGTVSPALNWARSVNAPHDDMAGLAIAAAVMSASPSGTGRNCVDGTIVSFGRAVFQTWEPGELDELARLMRKSADAFKGSPPGDA